MHQCSCFMRGHSSMDSPLGAFIAPKPPQILQTLNPLAFPESFPRPLQWGQEIMPYLSGMDPSGTAFFCIFCFLTIALKMNVFGLSVSDVNRFDSRLCGSCRRNTIPLHRPDFSWPAGLTAAFENHWGCLLITRRMTPSKKVPSPSRQTRRRPGRISSVL